MVAEAEENNLDHDALGERWARWYTCGLCEQDYYGFVDCALGWACWKTYLGRPEGDGARRLAMNVLANGLNQAGHHEDALPVREAELFMLRRVGAPEINVLIAQGNLAHTYAALGRLEEALPLRQEVYSGRLKLNGEEHTDTLEAALNYAASLVKLRRFEEANSLFRKTMPVARRVLGEGHELTIRMRMMYVVALYSDPAAMRDDLREAVTTIEETERTARRVFGGAHPLTEGIEAALRNARTMLRRRELPPPPPPSGSL